MNYEQLRRHINKQKAEGLKHIQLILKGMSPADYRRLDGPSSPLGKITKSIGNDDVVLFSIAEIEQYLREVGEQVTA